MKLTCKKIKEFIKDEKIGYEDYKKCGLKRLANDEYKHKIYLNAIKKRVCK